MKQICAQCVITGILSDSVDTVQTNLISYE